MAAVLGGVGATFSVTANVDTLGDVFRTTAPVDPRIMNKVNLLEMGAGADVADLFLDNAIYAPREQTLLVVALDRMPGVKGCEAFVRFAVLTSDADTAFFAAAASPDVSWIS